MASIPLPFNVWTAIPVNTTAPGQTHVTNPDLTHPIYVQIRTGTVVTGYDKAQPGQTVNIPFLAGDTVRAKPMAAITATVT